MVDLPPLHRLCLGGNVFGWTTDDAGSFAVLDAYVEAGGNLIDTAEGYSNWVPGHRGGESESTIGRWLARRDHDLGGTMIATKLGFDGGLTAAEVERRLTASLSRLGLERVDVLYVHKDDPAMDLDEVLGALDAEVRRGRVRVLGASNYTADRLALALDRQAERGWARFQVLQPGLSLLDRGRFEGELQDLAIARALTVVPYAALAGGLLSGKYDRSGAAAVGRSAGRAASLAPDAPEWDVVDALVQVARRHQVSAAAVAVAWVAAQPGVAAPIVSATHVTQLQELVRGASLSLSAEEILRLSEVSDRV